MSSGQRQRTPAEFPRMKDRAAGRRHRREQREAWELAQEAVASIPWLTQLVADGLRAMGEAFGSLGRALAEVGDAIDPPKRSDFALMPAPLLAAGAPVEGHKIQATFTQPSAPLQADVWTLPTAEINAIEHSQERYRQLMNLRRGQSSTYNQTEYR